MATTTTPAPKAYPNSFKNALFTDLGRPCKSDKMFTEDFVQGNLETIKVKGTTANKSDWEYKATVNVVKSSETKDDKTNVKYTPTFSDELKIKFPYNQRFIFWFGARKGNDLKFHADCGTVTLFNKTFNVFANSKFSTKFENIRVRLGANYFQDDGKFESNTRLECQEMNFCLTQRFFGAFKDNFVFGLVGTMCYKKILPSRFDYVLGYEKDSTKVYFKHTSDAAACCKKDQQCGDKNFSCPFVGGNYLLHVQRKFRDITFGFEAAVNAKDLCCKQKEGGCCSGQKACCPVQCVVGAWHQKGDFTYRHKLNCGLVFSNALKYKFNKTITVTAAAELNLKKLKDIQSFNTFPPIPFGYQIEISA